MTLRPLALAGALILAGCTAQQAGQVNNAVATGQLFCGIATTAGPLTVAALDASGVPLNVTGKASAIVAAWCAALGGVPVVPPSNPVQVPAVAAPGIVGAK